MSILGDYRAGLVADLAPVAPAGVTVTTDPAVGPPMILVDLARLVATVGLGAWEALIPVKCVTSGSGDAGDAELLEAMAEAVLGVLPAALPAEPTTYRPSLDVSLPMYELTHRCQIPNDHC